MSTEVPAPAVLHIRPRAGLFWGLLSVYGLAMAVIGWMWWNAPPPERAEVDPGPVIRLTVPDAGPASAP